jgi:hypothetical protein
MVDVDGRVRGVPHRRGPRRRAGQPDHARADTGNNALPRELAQSSSVRAAG